MYLRGSIAKGQAIEHISDIDTSAYVDLEKDIISYEWFNNSERQIIEQYPFVKAIWFIALPLNSAHNNQIMLNQSLCVYGEPIDVQRLKIDKNLALRAPSFRNRIEQFEKFYTQVETPEQVMSHCVWKMKGILRVGA